MDFHARQYDPQIGRFLGIDPLAASAGQDMFSPYAAMGNAPESMVDPNGMQAGFSGPGNPTYWDNLGNDANLSRATAFLFDGKDGPSGGSGGFGGDINLGGGGRSDGKGGWTSGASRLMVLSTNRVKTKTLSQMLGDAWDHQGDVVYNFGVRVSDYFRVGNDEYGNKQYLFTGTSDAAGTIGVYGSGYEPEEDGNETISKINEYFGYSTFLLGIAISFTSETKAGKYLAMGGRYVFSASSYTMQKSLINGAAHAGQTMKILGGSLGVFALGLTAVDMMTTGVNISNGMDAVFGVVSFVSGVGWVIGGIYFIGNTVSVAVTNKTVGQHTKEFVSPQNLDNMADDLIHYFSN